MKPACGIIGLQPSPPTRSQWHQLAPVDRVVLSCGRVVGGDTHPEVVIARGIQPLPKEPCGQLGVVATAPCCIGLADMPEHTRLGKSKCMVLIWKWPRSSVPFVLRTNCPFLPPQQTPMPTGRSPEPLAHRCADHTGNVRRADAVLRIVDVEHGHRRRAHDRQSARARGQPCQGFSETTSHC